MFSRLNLILALVLAGALGGAPSPARAQGPAAGRSSAAGAALVAERQRVRADLERTNAEIDALKRSGRGLREDYRLRAKLADAEALARRLTNLDSRLGAAPLPAWPSAGAEPRRLASDGPAELEAKADILSDQARRLSARGDALLTRAHDLKARQTLRRRVGQLERDPFSPLEGSRRGASAGLAGARAGGSAIGAPEKTPPIGPAVDSANPPSFTGGAPRAPSDVSVPTLSPGIGTSATTPGGGVAISAPKTGPTPTAPSTSTGSDATALSVAMRDLLDPATLAALQRLEAAGGPGSGIEALERAGAALKARADRLSREAAALRATPRAP